MTQNQAEASENARAPVGEEDLRLYLGPNADAYLAVRDRSRRLGQPITWSWNWWGLLFPVPWLFYRKLWAIGAALIVLSVLLEALVGNGTKSGLVVAALIGVLGMPLVLERAERKVREVDRLGLVSQASIDRLRKAGGVSVPGAVIGAALTLAALGLFFYGNLPAQLPGCAAPVVRVTVLDIAGQNRAETGLGAGPLSLDGIVQGGGAPDGSSRLCRAELRGDGAALPLEYEISWRSRSEGRYIVDLRIPGD